MTRKVITCASVTILAYHATYIATLPAMSPNTNHIYIAHLPLFSPLFFPLALDPRIKAHFYKIKCKPLPRGVYPNPSYTRLP
jgi:hypothetical protein